MRKSIIFAFLSMAYVSAAGAHTLGAEEGLLARLEHELLGIHHLPLTVLLVAVGIIAYRKLRGSRKT